MVPMELAVFHLDRQVINRGVSCPHQTVVIELPIFVSVGSKPVAGFVMPFLGKADCDAILSEGPELLDETVLQLMRPLAGQ